jgi:putative spermidine/putrescine transport system substrate-binding protein
MTHDSRRRTLLQGAAGAALIPALGLTSREARANDNQVIVGTWGGDYQNLLQKIVNPQAKGLEIIYDTGNAVARTTKVRAEAKSRRGSMDVALLADLDMYELSVAGVLEPITNQQVPRKGEVFEPLLTPYSIPHIFSAMVLVYDTTKFKTPPRSFSQALDPALKGRVGFSDIIFNFNVLFAGLSNGGNTSSFDAGMKQLMKLKANGPKVFPSNEAVAAALKSGEIWMTCMWKARALQWQKSGLPLGFVIPDEGAVPVTFEAAVPKNARNKKAAYDYMGAMLAPQGQVEFADAMGYAPTVRDAKMSAELAARVAFTPDELKRLRALDLKELLAQKAQVLDFWNKDFKTGL